MSIVGTEVTITADGTSVDTITYDIANNKNITRVFYSSDGSIISFHYKTSSDHYIKYVACDVPGALRLSGQDN